MERYRVVVPLYGLGDPTSRSRTLICLLPPLSFVVSPSCTRPLPFIDPKMRGLWEWKSFTSGSTDVRRR